ncbi:prepilin peptidase [Sinosporangium siamense]|uniref:Prepilin type IV endopeptidase peptidase domain-containing protein n=1 Tax=Sinosporangium siamense TaxID=1367973 RepID=A0A919V4S2_9ACTN|nr:A24 family peptidase [Sinosporangium siamense]GII92220.1 hypothetical protein Ssi02_24510 [Sinosporangium siamense]
MSLLTSLTLIATALLGVLVSGPVRALAGAFGEEPVGWREELAAMRQAAAGGGWRSVDPVLAVVTGVVCAGMVWRFGAGWAVPYLVVGLCAALIGILLAAVDLRTRRLPDVITLPAYPLLAVLIAFTGELGPALLGGLALGLAYLVLWLVNPGGLGLGDVKLAGLIGMVCGMLGVQAWTVAALGGQFLGALYGISLLVWKEATRKTEFAFGPFMLLGGLAGVLIP